MRREETEEEKAKVRRRLTLDWWSSSRCPAGGNRWPPEGRPPSRPAAGEIGWTTAWCRAESWGRLRTASRRKSYVLSVTCDTDYPRRIMINEPITRYIRARDRFRKITYYYLYSSSGDYHRRRLKKINVTLPLFNCRVRRYIYFKLAPPGSIVAFLFSI